MFERILQWLCGYLTIKITGDAGDRFLNICSKNNIAMWNVRQHTSWSEACISRKAFHRIDAYTKKTDVKIHVIEKKGLPFLLSKYKKRVCFLLGFLFCICAVYAFTLFIWDINVDGAATYTEEQIIRDIRENYVQIGTPKKKIDCAGLERELREKYDKIAWISCEVKGTRLNITFTETISPDTVKQSDTPCNIVAAKDGILTDVIIQNGVVVARPGDEVKRGDILITGVINIYNDFDELLETQYVPASGEVYAIVEYDYEDSFPMQYYEKEYTGEDKTYYGIEFFDKEFMPFGPDYDEAGQDIITEHNKLVFGNDIYLPVAINKTRARKYNIVSKEYTDGEAEQKAGKRLSVYLENLRKKGVEILENNVTIETKDGQCLAKGSIVTRELIGVPAEINIIMTEQGETP